jgi:hypothetical protein
VEGPPGYVVNLINADKFDGSEDGGTDGLTEEEREKWERLHGEPEPA